ncbi:MAG: metallophosphoesterase [Candidatus Omnitrophica bacterium]|nr:metallophosphoesterase [Candidatus Omnitrophota bacterium]
MQIGIISDTHDNLPKIEKAVKVFNRNKVSYVLHLGDYIAPFSVAILDKLNCPWQGVFGNNDGEKEGLLKISKDKIVNAPLRINLNNKNITVVHNISTIDVNKEKADVIFFGHTHKTEIKEGVLPFLLNPGECCGWLTGVSTIALVNLENLTYKILKI